MLTLYLIKLKMLLKSTLFFRMPLSANYIRVRCANKGVIQYAVSYEPPIDSIAMCRRLLFEHGNVIGDVRAFDGAILFLPHELPKKVKTEMLNP